MLTGLGLELANHVIEKVEYKTCADPACGRLFVRHGGRRAGATTRSDASYCSYPCAKTHSQKRYRADVKQARAWAAEGRTEAEIAMLLQRERALIHKWITGKTRV